MPMISDKALLELDFVIKILYTIFLIIIILFAAFPQKAINILKKILI